MRNYLCLVLAWLVAGCTNQGDGLARPPGVLGVPRATTSTVEGATLTVLDIQSTEHVAIVGEFYQNKYGKAPGWSGNYRKGAELAQWSDGNIQFLNTDSFKPKNPKKPGHMVCMFPRGEGSTVVLVTSTPK